MRPWVLLAVGLSMLLHALAVYYWLQRPVSMALPPAVGAVTVELLAAAPPVAAPEPPAAETAPPEPEALPSVVRPEMALPPKPVKKKPPAVPKPPAAVSPSPAPSAAPSAAVSAPVAVTAARYDAAYLRNPAPAYPPLSRRLNEQGKVLLRVEVSADGQPLTIELKQSSGFVRLDDAARKAVAQWRFVPARQGEAAVVSWVEVPVQFSLK